MSATDLPVADGCVVAIFYTLKDDEGEVLDTNRDGSTPLAYLHGSQNIVSGLEAALFGKRAGDRVQVVVEPEEGYGDHEEDLVQTVGRDELPEDTNPEPGMEVTGHSSDGFPVSGVICEVVGESVTIDFNHPLAGENLHFDVTIAEVRKATDEEREHGHPHEPGGHHHH